MGISDDKLKSDMIAIAKVVKELGVKREALLYHIEQGTIACSQGKIHKSDYIRIHEQRNQYIGLKEYICTHDGGLFEAKYAKNRNKYIDFLEVNDYFGVKRYYLDDVLFALPDVEEFYFKVEDIGILDFKSQTFFEDFGLSEEEKVNRLIVESNGHKVTIKNLKKYTENKKNGEDNIFTPSYTAFVKKILEAKDVMALTNADIDLLFDGKGTDKTEELLYDFLHYVRNNEHVKYNSFRRPSKEYKQIQAYSYEEYIGLARMLFSEAYDKENGLTEKALSNHKNAERWLFLSLHFMGAWRGGDICNAWIYPCLSRLCNPFSINLETLSDDIRNGVVTDERYKKIAEHCIDKIILDNRSPGKTGKGGPLHIEITEELKIFVGKLVLIAEHHHYQSGEGYMKENRMCSYCNWTECRDFFGPDFCKEMGKNHVLTRRLNKSYLQGLEIEARKEAKTTLLAHIVASYARNHANINTTLIYLKDHGLTGESADMVLHAMLERGVFGMYLYNALISAYPESFQRLTMKEQGDIMKRLQISSYDLQISGMAQEAREEILSEFAKCKVEEPLIVLKAMLEIGMGRGKAKDKGVYCMKRAMGEACCNPHYESCIGNVCPYHVFSALGLPALIDTIKMYQVKARNNKKYAAVLKKKIIPAFRDIINELIDKMSNAEKRRIKAFIEEALKE